MTDPTSPELVEGYVLVVLALGEDTRDYSDFPKMLRQLGPIVAELDRRHPGHSWEEAAGGLIRRELEARHIT
jgi:alpha-beta hydrolase superfamily lysophospholipase